MKLKGICPIIATPFTRDGKVDYDSLQNGIYWLADQGCHAATLFGIAGEYYKLSDAEAEQMVHVVVDACHKKGMPFL